MAAITLRVSVMEALAYWQHFFGAALDGVGAALLWWVYRLPRSDDRAPCLITYTIAFILFSASHLTEGGCTDNRLVSSNVARRHLEI